MTDQRQAQDNSDVSFWRSYRGNLGAKIWSKRWPAVAFGAGVLGTIIFDDSDPGIWLRGLIGGGVNAAWGFITNLPVAVWVLIVTVISVVCCLGMIFVVWHIGRRAEKFRANSRAKTEEELAATSIQRANLYKMLSKRADSVQRWEEIKKIEYSFCEWYPTAVFGSVVDRCGRNIRQPVGPAVDFLREILKNERKELRFKPYDKDDKKNVPWDQLNDYLERRACDIIVTPIYEVNSRMDEMSFCSPLYHAEIGCYVSESFFREIQKGYPNGVDRLSWNELMEFLRKNVIPKCPRIKYIKGELHEFICRRHLGITEELARAESVSKIVELITHLGDDDDTTVPFIFAERLSVLKYLEDNKSYKCRLRNLLKPDSFILPASFAVPYGNHTFRRYMNYLISQQEKTVPLQAKISDMMQTTVKSLGCDATNL